MRLVVCFLYFFCALNVQGQCQDSTFYIPDIFYLKANPIVERFNWCIYDTDKVDYDILIECKNKRKYLLDSLIHVDPKNPILYAYKICGSLDSKFYVDELDSIYSKFPTNSFINYSIFEVLPDELYDKRKFHLQQAIKYNTDSTQLSKLTMKYFYLDTIRDYHSIYNTCQKALNYDLSNASAYSMLADIHNKIDCVNDAKKYDSLVIIHNTLNEFKDYLKNSFCNGEFTLFKYPLSSSFNYELSKYFSINYKSIKTLKIINPSYIFYNVVELHNPYYEMRDSIFFRHFNIPFGYRPINFTFLDTLNTLFLSGGDSDFIPEIPRYILNLKSLKKIVFGLGMYIPKSEIEFIKRNYPMIQLVNEKFSIVDEDGIEYRSSFYKRLNQAGFPELSK